jgi:hypothetical protein
MLPSVGIKGANGADTPQQKRGLLLISKSNEIPMTTVPVIGAMSQVTFL